MQERAQGGESGAYWVGVFLRLGRGGRSNSLFVFSFHNICLPATQEIWNDLSSHIQTNCCNPFDTLYSKGELFNACRAHFCLFEAQRGLSAAMRIDAVYLNSPTACVVYRWAVLARISLFPRGKFVSAMLSQHTGVILNPGPCSCVMLRA